MVEEAECSSVVWTFGTGVTIHISDDSDTSDGARKLRGQLELTL